MNISIVSTGCLDAIGGHFINAAISVLPIILPDDTVIFIKNGGNISGRAIELAAIKRCPIILIDRGLKALSFFSTEYPAGITDQIMVCTNDEARQAAAHYQYHVRFGRKLHPRHHLNTLRGLEGAAVKQIYRSLAKEHGITWSRRDKTSSWKELSAINRAISMANACLYNLTEIAITLAGFSPLFGIVHSRYSRRRRARPFVYDIADFIKFDTVTPIAFRQVAINETDAEWRTYTECEQTLLTAEILSRLITYTQETIRHGLQSIPGKLHQPGSKATT